jgi:WD40 repeat protein
MREYRIGATNWLRSWCVAWCLLGLSWALQAQQPSTAPSGAPRAVAAPILRIDPGTHTAMLRAAAFDASRERLYTASDDKTVRVWQLPTGKLINTLRVPILDGPEGQLYALALSADGRWLAVGGWTGWDWEQKASVYIFDTQTEQLVQRLAVAPWTITSLRFSPDGQFLAVGMHGQGGLIIVRRANGQVVATDTAYQNKVMDMEFDRFGRLHTIGLDGFVRLYQQDFKLLARRQAKASKDPVAVRVSPDGEQLAVGFADAPVVEVLSARDLSTVAVLKAPANRQRDFVTVGWSSDGQYLYAGGDSTASGRSDVYRWSLQQPLSANGRTAEPQAIQATSARINDLWPLSQGRMLFITDAPSAGWVEPNGQVKQPIASAQWDFTESTNQLLLSPNASQISISASGQVMSYNVSTAKAQFQQATPGLQRPITQAPGWAVRISPDLRQLTLNNQAVALEEYERVRSHAIAANRSFVAVGTEWALRSYASSGQLQWMTRVSSPVWAVNVSADNQTVVAAIGDGTVRWFSAQTGRELLAVFMHRNAADWIAWIPGGYYASSAYGDRHIGWHINRGLDIAPDFIYAVQLERVLFRPDLVRTALDSRSAQSSSPAAASMSSEQMAQMAPPRLRIRLQGVDTARAIARISVEAERAGPEMQDIAVYVNDIPVTPTKDRSLRSSETRQFRRDYEVPLSRQVNDIRVEAFTGLSMGLARIQAEMPAGVTPQAAAGDLYVLAIGASQFDGLPQNTWLSYAAKDADTFASTLRNLQGTPFRNRHVKVLTDTSADKPTRANILGALDFLKNAKAEDTVVLFLASHGVSDARGNYYFVPKDAVAQDLKGLQAVERPQSLMSWQVFFDALRVVAGQRIMVVDTCQAKGIAGRLDPFALIKRSASSQFALMLASGENEESQEYDPAGHGLFTFGLLSSLQEAQTQNLPRLSLRDWFTNSARVVQRFRDRSIGPQTPQLLAPPILEQTALLTR